ncbi:MAG: UDP-2,4-diacetamido-2,4,6-trideoxy-beta-L-altropyranose hydrolase [Thermodesulfobacteriota bacterium]|nr:UDP-2,4-diacetamido-2,4,6-trideoxy-beta-L-altropyranose hydrolase [Thermodesulfobacteriota bacterium]
MINPKHLLIRADASSTIGTGHIMRCLALAQGWQRRGGRAKFLSCCDSNRLQRRIINEGIDFIHIENPYPDPSDLKTTQDILQKTQRGKSLQTGPWIVIDGYHFDSTYQKLIREEGFNLLVIDDMANQPFYYADIILNQNIHADQSSYHFDSDTKLLLGSDYTILRQEFLTYGTSKREIPGFAHRILVTLGGADSKNVTLEVIKALSMINDPDLQVKIVIGTSNPNLQSLQAALCNLPSTFHLLSSVDNIPELMHWADMAISGGGTTCWEMAFMGLPNLIIILADNQRSNAEELNKAGCSKNLGFYDKLSYEKITLEINKMLRDTGQRKGMSIAGKNLIDGRGIDRVLNEMNTIYDLPEARNGE